MSFKPFSVKVPASTANLGPGFDSVGLALDLYLCIKVTPASAWRVEYADTGYRHLPSGPENFIVETVRSIAEKAGKTLPAALLSVKTDIPLGRGFGSSASAAAAGIEIADQLLGLKLSAMEKVKIGNEIEGHPDNISASILGGLTISYTDGEELELIHVKDVAIGALFMVPAVELLTSESRGLLPDSFPRGEAVRGSAASNVMAAAFVNGDYQTAGRLMEKDTFHEPFRKQLFPDFENIRDSARKLGAYGTAVSGAGPSLFIAVPQGQEEAIGAELQKRFPDYECIQTKPSDSGIQTAESDEAKSACG